MYLCAYGGVSDASLTIGHYLDCYNRRRLHSSLDDPTPDPPYLGCHSMPPTRFAVPRQTIPLIEAEKLSEQAEPPLSFGGEVEASSTPTICRYPDCGATIRMRRRIASSEIVPERGAALLLSREAMPRQRADVLSGLAALWRRAQTPSRLAVAPALPPAPAWAGHTLMVVSTPSCSRPAG